MEYKVFGCKTNKYFAEKWLVHPHLEEKNGYFIASCVVTDKAKAKWVKHAKKILPKLAKDETLYLSGCGNIRDGVVDPHFFEVYDELVPFREKIEILPEDPDDFQITAEERKSMMQTKIRSLKKIAGKELFTRKYMVIQTGCDNFCTFCLTVQSRGRHKWRPMEEIIEEVRTFVEGGGKEVVFTGINLGAWGASSSNNYTESKFVELVSKVLEETKIERLRISSLGVEFCSDELISLFENPRIIAYAHLSIQSGSTSILKFMNRHYDGIRVREVLQKLRNIRRKDGVILNIGADLIVGFPGETDIDFADTLEIVEKYQISQLHAFPFSAHIDHYSVPAGAFDGQVPNHRAQSRIKKLLSVGKEVLASWANQTVGKEVSVLIEKSKIGTPISKNDENSKMGVRGEGTVGAEMRNSISMSGANSERVGLPLETFGTFGYKSTENGVGKVQKENTEEVSFSGWSENYLFCNEKNFIPHPGQTLEKGKVIRGIYQCMISSNPEEEI